MVRADGFLQVYNFQCQYQNNRALLYFRTPPVLWLLMIHHEEILLNVNRKRNPDPQRGTKVQYSYGRKIQKILLIFYHVV